MIYALTTAVPSAWNPVTITTAVLAVGALVLSLVNIVQNARHHPHPRVHYRWAKKLTGYNGVVMVELKMTNNGSADARGLRLDIDNARDQYAPHWFIEDDFAQGREETILVPVQPTVRRMTADGTIKYVLEDGTKTIALLRSKVTVQIAGQRTKTLTAPHVARWWKKDIAEEERKLAALSAE